MVWNFCLGDVLCGVIFGWSLIIWIFDAGRNPASLDILYLILKLEYFYIPKDYKPVF